MSAIVKLSKNSGLYPECLILRGVQKLGQDAVAGGSFGDIWKGDVGGHMIAIKVMRIFGASNIEKVLKVCYFVLCTRGIHLSALLIGIFVRGGLVATTIPSKHFAILWRLSLEW